MRMLPQAAVGLLLIAGCGEAPFDPEQQALSACRAAVDQRATDHELRVTSRIDGDRLTGNFWFAGRATGDRAGWGPPNYVCVAELSHQADQPARVLDVRP